MTKHPSNEEFHNAVMGGDVRLVAVKLTQRAAEEISEEIAAHNSDCAELASRAEKLVLGVTSISDIACSKLGAESKAAKAGIISTQKASDASAQEKRAFQFSHGITRAPLSPDGALAFTKISAMTFLEGAINTVFFYTAGFAPGIASAASIGFTIAGVTTLLSAGLGGGFFGKFWNYGIHAPRETPDMRKARRIGRMGSVLTSVSIAGVLCMSAIVRTTGIPDSLSISPETLSDVLTNMHSIMLILTGCAFGILSWRTALSAFSDPYPGYSKACEAVSNAEIASEKSTGCALDRLDKIQQDALDDLAAAADEIPEAQRKAEQAFDDLSDQYHRLLGTIDAEEAAIKGQAAEFLQAQQIITQKTSAFSLDDISLDHLRARIKAPLRPVFSDQAAFNGEYKYAVNAITVAYTEALDRVDLSDHATSPSSSDS